MAFSATELYESVETKTCKQRTGSDASRWGIVLAGGDGVRLRSLTRVISGDDRPKQFCRVIGRHTLLQQTQLRAARSIPARRTVYAVTAAHEAYFRHDLDSEPSLKLIQHCNRGTAPPIILSLFHIINQDPNALVAVLPCDHYYSNESAFTSALESAFDVASNHLSSIVLLGARPNGPDVEFGWIQLGAAIGKSLFRVNGFDEKPELGVAAKLFRYGALWNTFVMVGSATAFIDLAFSCLPGFVAELADEELVRIEDNNLVVSASLYEKIPTVDFSRSVLSRNKENLLVMPLNGLEWHDLGHADRVVSVVRSRGEVLPSWLQKWETICHTAPGPLPAQLAG
jgi:mannose-1-phosphate guanylyltransferase